MVEHVEVGRPQLVDLSSVPALDPVDAQLEVERRPDPRLARHVPPEVVRQPRPVDHPEDPEQRELVAGGWSFVQAAGAHEAGLADGLQDPQAYGAHVRRRGQQLGTVHVETLVPVEVEQPRTLGKGLSSAHTRLALIACRLLRPGGRQAPQ